MTQVALDRMVGDYAFTCPVVNFAHHYARASPPNEYDQIDYGNGDGDDDDDDDDDDHTFPQCLLVPLHTPHSEQPLAEVFREIETMQ